jgi:hypothetical protein
MDLPFPQIQALRAVLAVVVDITREQDPVTRLQLHRAKEVTAVQVLIMLVVAVVELVRVEVMLRKILEQLAVMVRVTHIQAQPSLMPVVVAAVVMAIEVQEQAARAVLAVVEPVAEVNLAEAVRLMVLREQ